MANAERVTERGREEKVSQRTFRLAIPVRLEESPRKETPLVEKTSLFVPRDVLFKIGQFGPSSFSEEVLVTRNIPGVLKAVFKHGEIAPRYGDNGLEQDPSRQQIIIYTMVACQDHLLWYQRAAPETVGREEQEHLGDPRLQGKISVGFGGHKTREDIGFSREELVFLRDLLSAIKDEIGTMLGLNRGFFNEVEEELGLRRHDVRDAKLLGAFYDQRVEDPEVKTQVGWVHTGIATVLEVDPQATDHLTFRSREIAHASWVPFESVPAELVRRQAAWKEGSGPKVETWTEILIHEFWQDYLSSH